MGAAEVDEVVETGGATVGDDVEVIPDVVVDETTGVDDERAGVEVNDVVVAAVATVVLEETVVAEVTVLALVEEV